MTETVKKPKQPKKFGESHLLFLKGFLRSPKVVASVIPSSRFLEQKLIESGDVRAAQTVVELGPGTGGTTQALLEALPSGARLCAIEFQREFADRVAAIGDRRLVVHHGSALNIREILTQHRLPAPELVVSGIPFSTMSPDLARSILLAVWEALAPGGRFVAYQFRDHVSVLGRPLFGKPEIGFELLNIPPMRVYRWTKKSAG